MVSKKWQRTQNLIAHIGLFLVGLVPFFLLGTTIPTWQKILFTVLGYAIIIPFIRYLHRRFANTFVKVFQCEFQMAARIIQRALNAKNIPFTKQSGENQIVFKIRQGGIRLEVDEFPLNLMVDDHLKTKIATKLTLMPETADNATQLRDLRASLDQAFIAISN